MRVTGYLLALALLAPFTGWSQTSAPYVNVRDFGARGDGKTDDTVAIQKAVSDAAGKPVYLPAGRYLVTRTISYHTTGYSPGAKIFGDGMVLTEILASVREGSVFDFDGSGRLSQFQLGGYMRDLTITGGGGTDVSGLQLTSSWNFTVDRVVIEDMSGSAIFIPLRKELSPNPDSYATISLTVKNARLIFNGGWGIYAQIGIGAGAMEVTHCDINGDGGGGIYTGAHSVRIIQSAIAFNGLKDKTGGLLVDYANGGGNGLVVEDDEFDTNYGYHIWVKGQDTFRIVGNRFLSTKNILVKDDQLRPPVHIKLGGGGHAVRDFIISQNYHRSKAGFQYLSNSASDSDKLILYQIADPSVNGTIERPWIPAPDNTKNIVKLDGNAPKVIYDDMKP